MDEFDTYTATEAAVKDGLGYTEFLLSEIAETLDYLAYNTARIADSLEPSTRRERLTRVLWRTPGRRGGVPRRPVAPSGTLAATGTS